MQRHCMMGLTGTGLLVFAILTAGAIPALADDSRFYFLDKWMPQDVALDGCIVVGTGQYQGRDTWVTWKEATGRVDWDDLTGGEDECTAYAVTPDGTVAVGYGTTSSGRIAARWTGAGGIVALSDPLVCQVSYATGVSDDGTMIVGRYEQPGVISAFRWTSGTGMQPLGAVPTPYEHMEPTDISGDGSVVIGRAWSWEGGQYSSQPFRWTAAEGITLLDIPGFVNTLSGDGSVIVGGSSSGPGGSVEAFRWTSEGGLVPLGDLPGGQYYSTALDCTDDGDTIVGQSDVGGAYSGNVPFIWTPSDGMRSLVEVMIDEYGLDYPPSTTFTEVRGVADRGMAFIGSCYHDALPTSWVFIVPEPATLSLLVLGGLALIRRRRK